LWNFAFKKNGQLLWCLNEKIGFDKISAVPIAVQGDTGKPFFLASLPGPEPNLHALGNDANLTVAQFGCMVHRKIVDRESEQKKAESKQKGVRRIWGGTLDYFRADKFVMRD